tara:strand:- start:419 stop:1018 length:600 start_codon:yes stop_codon:yes gene_type:complete
MSSIGTTSIDNLPINNEQNSNALPNLESTENIKIENYGQQLDEERKNDKLVQPSNYSSDINSILKEASSSGATVLQSRDIPQNTLPIQSDTGIVQNQIPENNNDYIGDIINREKMIKESNKQENVKDNMDYIFDLIQIPLLLSIMYFIFQLPVIRKNLFTFLPSLFNKDGNPNLYGYLFNSIIFGLSYFAIQNTLNFVN